MRLFNLRPLTNVCGFHSTAPRRASISPLQAENIFLKPQVQQALKQIIGYEKDIVFADQPVDRLYSARYVFMTNEELAISMERVGKRAAKILEVPPYKAPIVETAPEILAENPEIADPEILPAPIVFTDISPGLADTNRLIVVREVNGVLRRANRNERYRMNQLYWPDAHRFYEKAKMFQPEHLKRLLEQKEYKFILDRSVTQFELSDPEYHEVVNAVFTKMDEECDYSQLWGTRYFGSLAFHLVVKGTIDNILEYLINKGSLDRAIALVDLYYIVHNAKQEQFKKLSDEWQQLKVSKSSDITDESIINIASFDFAFFSPDFYST